MTRVAWHLVEPLSGDAYDMETNPSAATRPLGKTTVLSSTAGEGLHMLGADTQPTLHVTGAVLTQAAYDAIVLWYQKESAVVITDDLGQRYTCMLTKLTTPRVRSPYNPWHHTFTIDAIIFGGVLVPAEDLVPSDDLVPG